MTVHWVKLGENQSAEHFVTFFNIVFLKRKYFDFCGITIPLLLAGWFFFPIFYLYTTLNLTLSPPKNVTLYSKCPIYIHLNVALLCGYNGREKAKVNWFVFVRDVIRMRRHHSESSLWGIKWHTRTMTASLKRALKTHFGFENFRSKLQEDVVKAVVKGELANWLSTCRLSSSPRRLTLAAFCLPKLGTAILTMAVPREMQWWLLWLSGRWQGCVRVHANGSREVSLLPAACAPGSGHHSGHLASHRSHSGQSPTKTLFFFFLLCLFVFVLLFQCID